jgi:hypothetical protein
MEYTVTLIFSVGAIVLFIVGYRLVKRGSPFTRAGGDTYARKKRRKTIGQILWVAAGVLLVLAVINFIYVGGPSAIPDGIVTSGPLHAYVAPVLPPSPSDVDKAREAFSPATAGGDLTNQAETPAKLQGALAGYTPPAHVSEENGDRLDESPAPTPVPGTSNSSTAPDSEFAVKVNEEMKPLDVQLADANAALQKDSSSVVGYLRRGNIYGKKKMWDASKKDYQSALAIDSKCTIAAFNLAELDFLQAKYDVARPEFAALEQDPDFGDLAKYKVFLCDMVGGHEDSAAKELDAFNQVGSNASYYFANVAWNLYHKKDDDARSWMISAVRIYSPGKVRLYATPLVDLGYFSTKPTRPSPN